MRSARLLLVALGTTLFAGCIDHAPDPELPADQAGTIVPPSGSSSTTEPNRPQPKQAPRATLEVLKESVLVLMLDEDDNEYFCTGTLVAKDRVVTAGHCLERRRFHDYQVIAPLADGAPRVTASNPTPMSDRFLDVAEPDFGFLTLDEPIELAQYGVLTDVTARVDEGATVKVATAVRQEEEREAPLEAVDGLEVRSTTDMGYDHGFGVPLFSHGGDSGAGFFLVEDGQTTHKLVGVAREPDPDSGLDHITRVDAKVLAWYRANAGE
ncbi:MAG: trypsin-like serine protease [Labilithrix sp.]|nr:trypsin-like serine protease [Labilithrix sp.]MCW5817075.1 trypsin-like serine protease [Labilithrix sp.]